MSHQVEQSALNQKESGESENNMQVDAVQVVEEKKPEVVIKESEVKLVMAATHLARNAAIDLIKDAKGNIKEALKNYVTQE